jgi:predicted dithiol-disulfide oxidoreductase (DUF899 family)
MKDALTPAAELAKKAKTPFPGASAEYDAARQALLAEEIEFRRHMTRLTEQRRALRGWRDLNFVQTVGDDYAKDIGVLMPDGSEYPALIVFKRDGGKVLLFWASEMSREMADPGQDPRDAPDIASLWTILDLTPEGRGTDWYPKLQY